MNDKLESIKWARELLAKDFVVLDIETTGISPGLGDQAITIGVVDKFGDTILDLKIKPTIPISAAATTKHKYTNEIVAAWPDLASGYNRLKTALEGKIVMSYCANKYDLAILDATCWAHKLDPIELAEFHELLPQFAAFYGDWNEYFGNYKWQKLEAAAMHLGIDPSDFGPSHDAIIDCKTALAVLKAMAK